MKYLIVALFLASVAGVEVFHALSNGDGFGADVCTSPQGQRGMLHDLLLHSRH